MYEFSRRMKSEIIADIELNLQLNILFFVVFIVFVRLVSHTHFDHRSTVLQATITCLIWCSIGEEIS